MRRVFVCLWFFGGVLASQRTPNCLSTDGYQYRDSSSDLFIFVKRLNETNCLKVDVYRDEGFDFYGVDQDGDYHKIWIDPSVNISLAKYGISVQSQPLEMDLALEDPKTNQTHIYSKDSLVGIVFTVPYNFTNALISPPKGKKKNVVKIIFDTSEINKNPYAPTIPDKIFLIIDLINGLILVDIGIVIVLLFRGDRETNVLHRKIMWSVLFIQLLSLMYFLFRYQIYFIKESLFFDYFITSVMIDIFQIFNTSLGVYLETSILDKYVYQDIIFFKRLHRVIGFLAYVLIKINVLIKWLMFLFIMKGKVYIEEKVIFAGFVGIWVFFFSLKIRKLFSRKKEVEMEKLKLERRTSNLENTQDYGELCTAIKADTPWFIFEDSIYIINEDYTHPGGNFVLERVNRRNITRYFYGCSAVEIFPYKNLKFRHQAVKFDNKVVKNKLRLPFSPFFTGKSLAMPGDGPWHESFTWFIESVKKIDSNSLLLFLWSREEMIDRELIKSAVSNFGQYFVIHVKGFDEFKYSFIQMSSDAHFADLKRIHCNKLYMEVKESYLKTDYDIPSHIFINFNSQDPKTDFISADLINKYIRKFDNLQAIPPDDGQDSLYELPVIIQTKKKGDLLSKFDSEDSERIIESFENKLGPVKLKTRQRVAIGGPFGFENILTTGKNVFFYIDDWGLSAFQDFAYAYIAHFAETLSGSKSADSESYPPKITMNFVYHSRYSKLTIYNEFLVCFYLFEKTFRKDYVQIIFNFDDFSYFDKFLKENEKTVSDADLHVVVAKFKHANHYFAKLRKVVNRANIIIL